MLGQATPKVAHRQRELTETRSFRPDVEGLRAIAIALVVLYHYELGPFKGGYVGVDVFFVISGFVITSTLLRERHRTHGTSLIDFYARRIRRILPASTVVLVVTTVATFAVLGAVQGTSTVGDARAAVLFVANYHFAALQLNYFTSTNSPSPIVHYWSLSIEEQFYFVWPTLLLCLCGLARMIRDRLKLGIALALIIAASLAYSIVLTPSNETLAYYSSLTRAWELALGALVAVSVPLLARLPSTLAVAGTWMGIAGIATAAMAYSASTRFPGYAVALPVVGTALVIAGGTSQLRGGAEAILGTRPFLWLGALSYSLYLWHWPIWAIVAEDVGHAPPMLARVLLLALAVGASFASYRLVENPIRRSRFLKEQRRLSILLGVTLIGGTIFAVSAVGWAWPTPAAWNGRVTPVTSQAALNGLLLQGTEISSLPGLQVPLTDVATVDNTSLNPCLVSDTATTASGNRPAQCVYGDVHATTTVVLYGDSQMSMWLPAFNTIGLENHWRIELFARAACRVADLPLWDYPLNGPGTGCTLWHQWSVDHINALHPKIIVISDHAIQINRKYNDTPYSPAAFDAGFLHTVHELQRRGTIVVLLGPLPQPGQDPVTCLSRSGNVQACSTAISTARSSVNFAAVEYVATTSQSPYISVLPWFCTTTTCPTVVDHTVMYFDADHLSAHYAEFLVNLLDGSLLADAHI